MFFAHPMPTSEELKTFYQGFLYRQPSEESLPRRIADSRRRLCDVLGLDRHGHASGVFLDYGGGTGLAWRAAKDLGFDAHLYEVDEAALSFVRRVLGADTDHLLTDMEQVQAKRYDVILLDNVIEHVPGPLDLVRVLYDLLRPGGRLLIRTPNAGCGEMLFYPQVLLQYLRGALRCNSTGKALRRMIRTPFWTCDPPRHLFAFSRRSLHRMARMLHIPREAYHVGFYHLPLFEYSLTRRVFSRPGSVQGFLVRVLLMPLVAAELVAKLVQAGLSCGHLCSPGGIMLGITKPVPAR